MLQNVVDVNNWEYTTRLSWNAGDAPVVYFQLIDTLRDRQEHGFTPSGRRYMVASGGTLSVTLDNIDDTKKITRAATQPFLQDSSIWSIQILTTDPITTGTIDVLATLTEGSVVSYALAPAAVSVGSIGRI